MKTKTKKGFTLVELVIVIAVIAILAAVLIPTFSSLVKKANLSADEQAVKQMNTALAIYTAENDKPSTVIEVKKALDENLINTESMVPVTKGYAFYWDKENNKIVLVGDGKGTATNDWYILTSKEYGTETKAASLADITTAIGASSNAEPALIKVNSNIEATSKIEVLENKSVIIDLQGNSFNFTAGFFQTNKNGTLTIKNGSVTSPNYCIYNNVGDVTLEKVDFKVTNGVTTSVTPIVIFVSGISNTVIKECTITSTYMGLGSNAGDAQPGARVVITDTKIEAENTGIFMPINSNLTIENSNIIGGYFGIFLRGCSATISNTSVKHTKKPGSNTEWGSGVKTPVVADILFACGGTSFESYATSGNYTCENVTLGGETGNKEYHVVIHEPVGGSVSVSGIKVDIEYNESNNFNPTIGNN